MMPNQGSEWRHSPCQDQSEPPSVSFTIYLLLSIFLASWPLAIKRVGGSSIYRKSDNTVNSQNDQSPSVDHTHADTRLCRPQTYVWHGNLHVRHERYKMHGFSMLIIYRQCKAQYGTSPTVECKSSQDCSLRSTKCPEHDCLRGREGRSFCTWQVYRK